MLDFKRLTLDDLPLLRQHLTKSTGRFCDETPGTLFMWRNYYSAAYAEYAGNIILRYQSGLHISTGAFSLISGQYTTECISAICAYCQEQQFPVILSTVPEDARGWLKEHYSVKSEYCDDDWADYLYDAETMIALQGSSFGGQRNHIHQFRRKFPDAFCAVIDEKNLAEAKQFLIDYESLAPLKTEQAHQELHMTLDILDHYALFGMDGLLLYTEPGKICGLSLGENLGDTMYIHVEKALRDVPGCYPALTNQYARHFITPEIRYINREEDLGEPGLRRSKQSYHPVKMLKKYLLTLA